MMDYFIIKRKIKIGYYKILSALLYSRCFYSFGGKSKIISPLQLNNTKFMKIGSRVTINDGAFIMVHAESKRSSKVLLQICDGAVLGHLNHIVASNYVEIGKNVLTADRVYITDNYHGYEDVITSICQQEVKSKGETVIGPDTWLGENVCVISSRIGKHCIIAANSVVISDIPDYCVAAGIPAQIKKKYNFVSQKWEKV